MIDLNKYFKIAEIINLQASKFLLSRFGTKKEMTHKTGSHYGILEDSESNTFYEDFFRENSPEVALYTEEGERNLNNELVWVVDPIEGTSNFRVGIPFWATQVALLYKNEPVLGIVNAPALNQKFYAIKNQGAFLNNDKITVSQLTELDKAMVDMVRGTKDEDKDWAVQTLGKIVKKVRTNRVFGACGLDISYCSAGLTDIFISKGVNLYDLAAGSVIAKEAGATLLNFNGGDWTINDDEFLMSNDVLAKEALKILL